MSGHDKAQSTTPPTPLNEQLDSILKDFVPHYSHQYCNSICPRYRANEQLKALIESQKQALLDHLLSHGHGGGNWRRLIEQAKAEKKKQ